MEKTLEAIERFEDLAPQYVDGNDIEFCILKGQIILEEVITTYLRSKFEKPDFLHDFGASQKLKIASGFNEINEFIDPIKKLNNLRNKFAHKIESEEFIKAANTFIGSCASAKVRDYSSNKRGSKMAGEIWKCFINLYMLVSYRVNEGLELIQLQKELDYHNNIVASYERLHHSIADCDLEVEELVNNSIDHS